MTVDLAAAERFVLTTARLVDRHRAAVLLHGAGPAPVLAALAGYRNPDGGFGHALEPDLRGPGSEPASTLHALDVIAAVGACDVPLAAEATSWVARIAGADGGVPFVLPDALRWPHAPWMQPSDGGSFLTFALTAVLLELGVASGWVERGAGWSWQHLRDPDALGPYALKYALAFVDAVDDQARAHAAIDRLRGRVEPDGSIPVEGGAIDERLTVLDLSPRPGRRSRALFDQGQVEADLDRLEAGQDHDGGWRFDWLAWAPAQEVEWRGAVTVRALETLAAHGRLRL